MSGHLKNFVLDYFKQIRLSQAPENGVFSVVKFPLQIFICTGEDNFSCTTYDKHYKEAHGKETFGFAWQCQFINWFYRYDEDWINIDCTVQEATIVKLGYIQKDIQHEIRFMT